MDQSGNTFALHTGRVAYYENMGQDVEVSSNMRAYYVNNAGQKTQLIIHEGQVYLDDMGTMKIIKENSEGVGYYSNGNGQMVALAQAAESINSMSMEGSGNSMFS